MNDEDEIKKIPSAVKKIPLKNQEDYYMDGLVSTGNRFPSTILNRISVTKKNYHLFY